MTVVVIVAVVITLLVLARLAWRAVWSERHSIDHHEHAMEVLRDLSSRAGADETVRAARTSKQARPHVYPGSGSRRSATPALFRQRPAARRTGRLSGWESDAAASDANPRRAAGTAPAREAGGGAAAKKRMVFISDDLAVEAPPGSSEPVIKPVEAPRVPGRLEESLQTRSDVDGPPSGVGAVEAVEDLEPGAAAATAGGATAGGAPSPGGAEPESTRRPVVGAAATERVMSSLLSLGHPRNFRPRFGLAVGLAAIVVAAAAIAGVLVSTRPFSASEQHQIQGSGQAHKAVTHTAPPAPPPAVTAVSSDALGAQFQAPQGNFTVVLNATGPCWTEVSATPNGSIQSEGTLTAGQSKSIPAYGTVWIRLGDPKNVSITMNGSPVQLPSSVDGSPYNLTFSTSTT